MWGGACQAHLEGEPWRRRLSAGTSSSYRSSLSCFLQQDELVVQSFFIFMYKAQGSGPEGAAGGQGEGGRQPRGTRAARHTAAWGAAAAQRLPSAACSAAAALHSTHLLGLLLRERLRGE